MTVKVRTLILAGLLFAALPAAAQFERLPHLNLKEVDPSLAGDFFGVWEIRDKTGKKRCRIDLKKTTGAGGYQIDIAKNCAKDFPVMGEIDGWHLLENWTIDLIDANFKTRVRFSTPDDNYVAIPEVDGIATLAKPKRK
jgi:hypothetical protein